MEKDEPTSNQQVGQVDSTTLAKDGEVNPLRDKYKQSPQPTYPSISKLPECFEGSYIFFFKSPTDVDRKLYMKTNQSVPAYTKKYIRRHTCASLCVCVCVRIHSSVQIETI